MGYQVNGGAAKGQTKSWPVVGSRALFVVQAMQRPLRGPARTPAGALGLAGSGSTTFPGTESIKVAQNQCDVHM